MAARLRRDLEAGQVADNRAHVLFPNGCLDKKHRADQSARQRKPVKAIEKSDRLGGGDNLQQRRGGPAPVSLRVAQHVEVAFRQRQPDLVQQPGLDDPVTGEAVQNGHSLQNTRSVKSAGPDPQQDQALSL